MSGPVITGSGNTTINDLGVARINDIVVGYCGHSGIIVTGVHSVPTNDLSSAHVGSVVTGCCRGTIVTGSANTISE